MGENAVRRVSRVFGRLVQIAYICGALLIIVLGAHGVYVHVSPWEAALKGESALDKLFLVVATPSTMTSWVQWMSFKGCESWFIPACFIVAGLLLIANKDKIRDLIA